MSAAPAAEERVTNAALQRQFDALTARFGQFAVDIQEIKQMLRVIEERVRQLENTEAGIHPLMESRIDAAWRKLEEHTHVIDGMRQSIVRLEQANRLLSWLGGILGSAVLIWLVTQILAIL